MAFAVPRLGVESELQLPATAIATAAPDPSRVCDPYCSSRQHQILNPLSEARDRTHILMEPSRVREPLRHEGNSICFCFFLIKIWLIYNVVSISAAHQSDPVIHLSFSLSLSLSIYIFFPFIFHHVVRSEMGNHKRRIAGRTV